MPRDRTPLPSSRHHIMLFDEDWEFLNRAYGKPGGMHAIGVSEAIRAIVHAKVVSLKAKANSEYDRIRDELEGSPQGEYASERERGR